MTGATVGTGRRAPNGATCRLRVRLPAAVGVALASGPWGRELLELPDPAHQVVRPNLRLEGLGTEVPFALGEPEPEPEGLGGVDPGDTLLGRPEQTSERGAGRIQ